MRRRTYTQAELDALREKQERTARQSEKLYQQLEAYPTEATRAAFYMALHQAQQAEHRYNEATLAVTMQGMQTVFETRDPYAPQQLAWC